MIVHLYALNWNESRMLPFFFEHYRPFVQSFFIYDDQSDDGSREFLEKQSDVVLRDFERPSDQYVIPARDFYRSAWKASRGKADWVIVVNIDEFVHAEDIVSALASMRKKGVTAVKCTGWQMVSESFPTEGPLTATVANGVRALMWDKIALFDPNAIDEIEYDLGRHGAVLSGRVKLAESRGIHLLHFNSLGLDHVRQRYIDLNARRSPDEQRNGWGWQYALPDGELTARQARLEAAALPVLKSNAIPAGQVEELLSGCFLVKTREVRNARGGLREVWRQGEAWGAAVQHIYTTTTVPGSIKAWYFHKNQTDHIMVLSGGVRFVLFDGTAEPRVVTLTGDEPATLIIPPRMWHGFKAISDTPALLLHHNDRPFDWVNPDERRLPPDTTDIPYRWEDAAA